MYVSLPHREKVLIAFINLHVAFKDFYLKFRCFHELNEVFLFPLLFVILRLLLLSLFR